MTTRSADLGESLATRLTRRRVAREVADQLVEMRVLSRTDASRWRRAVTSSIPTMRPLESRSMTRSSSGATVSATLRASPKARYAVSAGVVCRSDSRWRLGLWCASQAADQATAMLLDLSLAGIPHTQSYPHKFGMAATVAKVSLPRKTLDLVRGQAAQIVPAGAGAASTCASSVTTSAAGSIQSSGGSIRASILACSASR
jgi:hypothetical protein